MDEAWTVDGDRMSNRFTEKRIFCKSDSHLLNSTAVVQHVFTLMAKLRWITFEYRRHRYDWDLLVRLQMLSYRICKWECWC